ncbi:MAG: ABC transporter permease [Myxococcaceae bacterium]
MDALFQDLKAAARSLRARKGFVALAVGTLALALGANSSVFGVIHAVLLEQLPYRDPERLAILWNVKADGENEVLSVANFEDYQAGARALDRIAAWFEQGVNLTGEGEPERLFAARVSPGFFEVLGARPALGRTLGSADHDGGGAHVAILGDTLWRSRFGGDPTVIGRTLRLGDDSYEVVGVMAPGFFFPGARADLALPLDLTTEPRRARRDDGFLRVVARLASGVTRAQGERQMSEIARELRTRYPETNSRQMAVSLPPLADELVGAFRSQLRLLQAAVGLVVLIACLNLAMLLLASSSGRSREMAVKSALGASRGRLARQLFFESLALAAGGGLLGALVGVLGTRALVALSPAQVPRLGGAHFGMTSLAFTLAVAALTAIVFGLGPALSVSSSSPQRALGDGRSSAAPSAVGARRVLVAIEVALSLTLLTVAGLMVISFARLLRVDPGFRPGGALSLRVTLPASRYAERERLERFQAELRARLLALPGVREAGSVQLLPLSGGLARVDFTVEGSPPGREEDVPSVDYRMVSPGYLRAAGIPLLAGRELSENDRSAAPPVALVNHRLAERFFPGRSAVGRRLMVGDGGASPRPVEIVGVVGDVRDAGLDSEPGLTLYIPLPQVPQGVMVYARNMFWVIRTSGDPQLSKRPVLAALHALDGLLPATAVQTLDEALSRSVAPRRFNLLLVDLFAVAALLLSALGVYSVSTQTVALRRRELAIRVALGAAPRGLLRLVIGGAMRPVLLGLLLGLGFALVAGRSVSGLLYRVKPTDPAVLLGAAAVLGLAALLAVWIPARRAARADPLGALSPE